MRPISPSERPRVAQCGEAMGNQNAHQQMWLPECHSSSIIGTEERILVTGARGFIGSRVVGALLARGYRNIVCFTRPSSATVTLDSIVASSYPDARVDIVTGNLLSRRDCETACRGVRVIYHLAAGVGEKSFPDAYVNSVVATRNVLDASIHYTDLKRFVLVSSFAVYTNRRKARWRLLDETCPTDDAPELRGDAYCYAKVRQEQLLAEYAASAGLPYVVVRPGSVYGPGKRQIPGRVGIDTFGVFLHLGGPNTIPFTYVDNCAHAVVLAGLVPGVEGEVFNVVDDDLPSSRNFLRLYKSHVRPFTSIYVPHPVSHALCYLWELYSHYSHGQLPPAFNRGRWHADWKRTYYSNAKLKSKLGWSPLVATPEGLRRYFTSCL